MKAKIAAIWQGSFKNGKGQYGGEHSPLHAVTYKHNKGANENTATNPEELMGAAHAACYTMTLSFILEQAGIVPESLETTATITVKNNVVTNSDLVLAARIPDLNETVFQEFASKAKETCPVGNAYKADISLQAKLIS